MMKSFREISRFSTEYIYSTIVMSTNDRFNTLYVCMYVCMYKGWAIKLALAPRPLMIYCASPLAAAMIITVAALRIVLAHGTKPT
jgi:hypothetical protein